MYLYMRSQHTKHHASTGTDNSVPLFKLHWQAEGDIDVPVPSSPLPTLSQPIMPLSPSSSMSNLSTPSDAPAEDMVPRGYQLQLFHRAVRENVIAFLDTGAGKTLVSALLIKKTIQDLDKLSATEEPSPIPCDKSVFSKSASPTPPSRKVAVFLVHRVPLVPQQAQVIRSVLPDHIHVGAYYGEKGCDDWSSSKWALNLRTHKVLIMTAQIFLNLLRHGLIDIRNVALLVLDEVHHATKNHPYRRLFVEFYHTLGSDDPRPRVFGMTATPVKAKAASRSERPCLDAIIALEATLDAAVVTVSNEALAEVEELVPKPDEFVVIFSAFGTPMDLDEEEANDLDAATVSAIVEIADLSIEEQNARTKTMCRKVGNGLTQKERKLLSFLCWKVGFRAASHFGQQLCAIRGIPSEDVIDTILKESCKDDIKRGGVPEKVSILLDVLFYEYGRTKQDAVKVDGLQSATDQFRCIVFVHERVCAVALTWLINEVFKGLCCSELSAKAAVGVQNTDSHVRMSQAKLLDTLAEFRIGKFGILVATNVVEEGLDVPACRLVTAFDPVTSPTAYVQGRGRARKRGARYIAMLEHGSIDQYNSLLKAREGANLMRLVAESGTSTEAQRREIQEKLQNDAKTIEKKLFSKTTRAQVSGTEAINLLNRYCSMKAGILQDHTLDKPKYIFTQTETGIVAKVNLNTQIPIDFGICDIPQETELFAKRLAALDAYSKLYEIGEVDDFLLPKRPVRSRRVLKLVQPTSVPTAALTPMQDGNKDQEKRKKQRSRKMLESKESKKERRLRRCHISHPSSVQYEQSFPPQPVALEASHVTSHNVSTDRKNTKNSIEKSIAVSTLVDTPEKSERLIYSVQVDHDITDLGFHDSSSHLLYGILLKNEVDREDLTAIQCPMGHKLLTLKLERKIPWSIEKQTIAYNYVRFIQLCLRGRSPGSEAALDIAAREYGSSTTTGFVLVPLLRSKGKFNDVEIDWSSINRLLSFGWRYGPLEKSDYDQNVFQDSLVCSYHENLNRVYLSGSLNEKLRASSNPGRLLNRSYHSFADYFERKHETPLADKEQVMLEAFSVLDKVTRLSTSTFMLPPETCRVIPIPPLACYVASLLPKWQTFLALRACWRRNRITTDPSGFLPFARALQPNVNNVAKKGADLSYERLEFLGDAVLKVIYSMAAFVMNPDENEGELSDERDVGVSNQKLADWALEMRIDHCVAFSGVSQKAKVWPWFWATNQNESIQISEKVLADCVEALIGVQYLEGGIELAATFMDRHDLLPGACKVLGMNGDGKGSSGVCVPVPSMKPEDDRRDHVFVTEVEDIIGYHFKDKGHLVVALTHGSYKNGACPSYQRYEYLGDAIIGFLMLAHFYDKYPELGPGDLTSLRGPALSNDLFARVIVSLKIHQRFWCDCPPLSAEAEKFAMLVTNEEDDGDDICKQMTVPKVLGDLLESIIGAIVVDKGMRLDGVAEIVLRLMHEEVERFANPDKFQNNPVSELVHLVQKHLNILPDYQYLDESQDIVKRCVILVAKKEVGTGTGPTRRLAKHKAAQMGLEFLLKRSDLLSVPIEKNGAILVDVS